MGQGCVARATAGPTIPRPPLWEIGFRWRLLHSIMLKRSQNSQKLTPTPYIFFGNHPKPGISGNPPSMVP